MNAYINFEWHTTKIDSVDIGCTDYECRPLLTQLYYVCVSRMRSLKVMFLATLLTWLHLVAAASGPDSPETNEADHSHSSGGCDCMEYWTCVMR